MFLRSSRVIKTRDGHWEKVLSNIIQSEQCVYFTFWFPHFNIHVWYFSNFLHDLHVHNKLLNTNKITKRVVIYGFWTNYIFFKIKMISNVILRQSYISRKVKCITCKVYFSFLTADILFQSLFVPCKSEGRPWLHTFFISWPFIPLTIPGNTESDLNQRDKGRGGTTQPTETKLRMQTWKLKLKILSH